MKSEQLVFWTLLFGFVLCGFALRTWTAVFWPRVERPDEIFQNLEPAFRLWTGRGIVTWEWREGIRSLLFPEVLSGVLRLSGWLHLPHNAAFPLIWAILSVVSCGAIVVGVTLGWRRFGVIGATLCGILTAFWPDLVYYGPKTLVEVQAGNLLVIAAGLASLSTTKAPTEASPPWERSRQLCIGLLLGAAFALRFQLALALLLTACWSARLDARRWLWLAVGGMLPLAALGWLDWVTLGTPFQSIWKNVAVNLLHNKAAEYGVSPFYDYGLMLVGRHGAIALALAALFVVGFRTAPLLALVALLVIGFHSAIGHKEISFIYAALPCTMIVAGLGLSRLVVGWQAARPGPARPGRALAVVAATTCAAVAAIGWSTRPFAPLSPDGELQSLWGIARAQPDLCGLALFTDNPHLWGRTGGEGMLARPVPIYMAMSPEAFAESRSAFNYVIAQRYLGQTIPGLEQVHCHGEYCLFHQPIQCHPDPLHELSAELARHGK